MKETQRIDNSSVNDDLFVCKLNGVLFKMKKKKQIKNGKNLLFFVSFFLNQ